MNLRLPHLLLGILLSGLAALVALGVVGRTQTYESAGSSSSPAAVAGVTYRVQASRPLDDVGDAATIRALPASLRRPSARDLVYGVFITAANSSDRTLPLARRFELVDSNGRTFTPLPLGSTSAYRYPGGRLPPGGHAPASTSPPAENLAEQGYVLVFRVPRASALEGLSLHIFDPTGTTAPGEILVQS
jgi:hypothetical protein